MDNSIISEYVAISKKKKGYDERTVFSAIEKTENELYDLILSFKPLYNFVYQKLMFHFEQIDPEQYKDFLNSDKLKTKKSTISVLRLHDAGRNWAKEINEIVSSSDYYFDDQTDNEIISLFYKLQNSKSYQVWSKKVTNKYREVVKLKNDFATCNLGLVVDVIRRQFSKMYSPDFQQEGYFGLVRAIDKFDYTKGWKFATYACYWIRNDIQRYLENRNDLIRSPVHAHAKRSKLLSAIEKFESKNNRKPTTKEIRQLTGMNENSLSFLMEKFSFARLDSPIYEDGLCLHETLADDQESSFDFKAKEDVKKVINNAMKVLTTQERRVILERFGFNGEELMLQDLGNQYGVSRERIRQVQNAALLKLKATISIDDCI